MKVIFVASGNKKGGSKVSAFVQSQYDSLKKEGLDMQLIATEGNGVNAYLRAVLKLRKMIRAERPDVLHAHYSLCGWVASLACFGLLNKPKVVVSILGSFPIHMQKKAKIVRWSTKHLWDKVIVKSQRTANQLGVPVNIIPNGVDLEKFRLVEYSAARKKVGFKRDTKYVIWCSDPERKEKNWPLAVAGVQELKKTGINVELIAVFNKTPEEVRIYMNAADCVLLTSNSEGSPNVIKEAMACNCPIVSTNVGDVEERLYNLDGCFIVNDEECRFYDTQKAAKLTADELAKALSYSKRTMGRQRIIEDRLEISQIAKRIIEIYNV